jgi:hypothetical protein
VISVLVSLRELYADHPQLLLEGSDDLDHSVLRGGVEFAEPVHCRTRSLRDLGHAAGELADYGAVLDRA